MRIYKILALALLCMPAAAFGTVPAYVGSNYVVNTPTTTGTAIVGDDFILTIHAMPGSNGVLSRVTDGNGAPVLTDFAFDATSGLGIYRVHDLQTAGSDTLTVNWGTTPSAGYVLVLTEVSGIAGIDTGAGTPAIVSGTSTTPTTGSLTPAQNNDLLLSNINSANSLGDTFSSPTNGFTQTQTASSGPTFWDGYLVQSSAASVDSRVTVSGSIGWYALLIAYKPVGGASPQKGGMFFASMFFTL